MRSRPWNRGERIAEVRDRIWQYLSPAVRREEDVTLQAGRLLQLPDEDAAALGRIHFLLSAEVEALLAQMPWLLRRLATESEEEEEWSAERVRGAVRWGRTLSARSATGVPTLHVTAPAVRAYRRPENELLTFVLAEILDLARTTTWLDRAGPIPAVLRARYVETQHWRRHRLLAGIPAREPSPRALSRIRSGRHRLRYRTALDAYRRLMMLTRDPNRRDLRHAVEQLALVVASDSTLFEVICTFDVIDAMTDRAWRVEPLGLFEGGLHLEAYRNEERIDLWYQEVPPDLVRHSRYRRVLNEHRFAAVAPLRPDVVLRRESRSSASWLLIEMKMGGADGGGRSVGDSARAALADLLAYRRDFGDRFQEGATYGLGVAWGEDLTPQPGEVMLATPDHVQSGLDWFLS